MDRKIASSFATILLRMQSAFRYMPCPKRFFSFFKDGIWIGLH